MLIFLRTLVFSEIFSFKVFTFVEVFIFVERKSFFAYIDPDLRGSPPEFLDSGDFDVCFTDVF